MATEWQIYRWLHLISFAGLFGASISLLLVNIPMAAVETDRQRKFDAFAGAMKIFDPLLIATTGVLIMTGAFQLTAYKAILRGRFFTDIGSPLVWKLLLTFILIIVATYISFGIGHRVVRAHQFREEIPVEDAWIDGMLKRARYALITAILLILMIVWISMRLPTLRFLLQSPA